MVEIVLAGIGHTNAEVVRRWAVDPIPGARLTCISAFPVATYSGMLPGVLAGRYERAAMEIDVRRLCERAGATLEVGQAIGCDRTARRLRLADGREVGYDVLVVGVGSQTRPPPSDASSIVSIKPMPTFLDRLDAALDARRSASPLRVAVVGNGAGGTELALCLPAHLRRRGFGGGSPERDRFELSLIGAAARPPAGSAPGVARRVSRELQRRGVRTLGGVRVRRADERQVELDDGRSLPVDLVIWAADAVGADWLRTFDLPLDERGFLLTRPTLQSTVCDELFAVGDSGSIVGAKLPKAGVYAVREGPVLWENLRRLTAGRPLEPYRPQRRFLRLLNLGDGRAIGEYAGFAFQGRWVWRWKDRIDRRFVEAYRT